MGSSRKAEGSAWQQHGQLQGVAMVKMRADPSPGSASSLASAGNGRARNNIRHACRVVHGMAGLVNILQSGTGINKWKLRHGH